MPTTPSPCRVKGANFCLEHRNVILFADKSKTIFTFSYGYNNKSNVYGVVLDMI